MYASYLVHFNKNHDPKSGRFTFGKNEWKRQANEYTDSSGNKKSVDSNEDSDKLAKTMSKMVNSNADYIRTEKINYFTDKQGNVLRDENGFKRAVLIYDKNKKQNYEKEAKKFIKEKNILKEKYNTVFATSGLVASGEAFVEVMLVDKLNNIYATRLETKYDDPDLQKAIKARLYSGK